ncbi:MAG: histidine kinase, partial [Planctomycetota bacterium]
MAASENSRWKRYLVITLFVGAWTLLLAFSLATLYYESSRYQGGRTPYLRFLFYAFVFHGPWIFLAPLLLLVFDRFPFSRKTVHIAAAVHWLVGSAACSLKWCVEYAALEALDFPVRPLSVATVLTEMINYITLLIGYTCVVYYRRYRDREAKADKLQAELANARLQMLKMQLNPHFLFNTLHAISSLVYDDPRVADKMISRLSDLLR